MAVKIDPSGCTGCGACILACPQDVLRLDEERKKAFTAYIQDCTSCRECLLHCPFHCMEVVQPPRKVTNNFTMRQYLLGLGIDLGGDKSG